MQQDAYYYSVIVKGWRKVKSADRQIKLLLVSAEYPDLWVVGGFKIIF